MAYPLRGGEPVVHEIDVLLPDLAEQLSRAEIIDRLRYEAEAADSSAKRMRRRGGDQGAKREARHALHHRIDRILNFLIHDSLVAVPDEVDRALCERVRERLQARGQW